MQLRGLPSRHIAARVDTPHRGSPARLFVLWFAGLRGDTDATIFGRSLPPEIISRAAGLALGSLIFLGDMVFFLMVTESPVVGYRDRGHLEDLVFEAHSAFGSGGLSTGITAGVPGADPDRTSSS